MRIPNPVAEMKRIYLTTGAAPRLSNLLTRRRARRRRAEAHAAHARVLAAALAAFPDRPPADFNLFDEEAIAAVDKFRTDKNLTYQGNPPGLVDARLIDALRTAYLQKKKGG